MEEYYKIEKYFRVKKDSLDELRMQVNALYGEKTQRAVENFPISGLLPWRAFICSIASVKRAAAEVNFDLDLFNSREVGGQRFSSNALSDVIPKAAQE